MQFKFKLAINTHLIKDIKSFLLGILRNIINIVQILKINAFKSSLKFLIQFSFGILDDLNLFFLLV